MNEFLLIFRSPAMTDFQPSPEQIQASIKKWQDWIGGIAAQGKFVSTQRLGSSGKVLKPGDVVTDGPYAELKEMVGGFLILKADALDEAVELAKGCPVLEYGGHVEVRDLMAVNV